MTKVLRRLSETKEHGTTCRLEEADVLMNENRDFNKPGVSTQPGCLWGQPISRVSLAPLPDLSFAGMLSLP